jgi:endonuclease YncB( thermonuclease family)
MNWLAGPLVLLALPAAVQVTDGDTLKQRSVTFRVWGIDAPELQQTFPDGWPAGGFAATRLAGRPDPGAGVPGRALVPYINGG